MKRGLLFFGLIVFVVGIALAGKKGTLVDKEYFPSTPQFPHACYQFVIDTWHGQEVKCVSQHDYDNFYIGDKF